MVLDAIRDQARATIHAAFALPAVVTSPNGLSSVPLTARLHRKTRKPFGDLGSDGFALVIESEDKVIFDVTEWVPQRNWRIDFGRGRVFRVVDPEIEAGERYVHAKLVQDTEQ